MTMPNNTEISRLIQALDVLGKSPDTEGEALRCHIVLALADRYLSDGWVGEIADLDKHGNVSPILLLSLRRSLKSVIKEEWGMYVHITNQFKDGALVIAVHAMSALQERFNRSAQYDIRYVHCMCCNDKRQYPFIHPIDLLCDCGAIRSGYNEDTRRMVML